MAVIAQKRVHTSIMYILQSCTYFNNHVHNSIKRLHHGHGAPLFLFAADKVPKESAQGFLRTGYKTRDGERMSERYERAYERAEENGNLCAKKGLCEKTCESKETQGAFCRKKSHACAGIAKFHKRWLKSLKIPCGNGIL